MKFQIIYKCVIFTDNIPTYEEALESFQEYTNNPNIEEKYLSIEVEIPRDDKRHQGFDDTRATIEEVSADFITNDYTKAMNTIEEMKRLLR